MKNTAIIAASFVAAAVVSIPCTGAGTSSVQLKGCTEDNTCADSPVRDVTITG